MSGTLGWLGETATSPVSLERKRERERGRERERERRVAREQVRGQAGRWKIADLAPPRRLAFPLGFSRGQALARRFDAAILATQQLVWPSG